MTSDPRLDRLEGIVEELREEVHTLRSEMRSELNSVRAEISSVRAEISSRLNTHLVVMVGLWATTLAAILGLFFKG